MGSRTLRVGIIGAGHIAHAHLRELVQQPGVQISAVVDVRADAARALARACGATACATVEQACSAIDAAYLLTPPRVREHAVAVLTAAGIPVLCEKPLAADVPSARRLAELVRAAGSPFMVGFVRRWHPPYQRIRTLVAAGELGRLLMVQRQRLGYLPLSQGNWRTDPSQAVGMTVESLSHDLDLLRWLVGEVVEIEGRVVGSRPELRDFDDTVLATARFADGTIGSWQASWMSAVEHNSLALIGDAGTAVLSGRGMWRSDSLTTAAPGATERVELLAEDEAADMGFAGETTTFLALARGEQVEHPTVEDGLRTVELSASILS
ncbi:gfo/Idh/MocA family oxidoreductase [Desertihabitans brevis]|uniref:Gfo/Idh/MocA family oxidoreductase n=1 Tax=Desertihabitans brevis TaxID=2268447 RepID=A0A367YT81_9ACTN|nr:Gfo/Idh/MocA family oxidoreductase [Desertihabitans brevis]RCK68957.1 gfo/Idh/MocA family oxidoreductase [Desertihabitans brevis]